VRRAYDVATVRAAEAALTATLPAGTLMGRAADGVASTCSQLLGRVYGSRVVLLVGSGDNGGDALYAGARLARRGARVDAVVLGERVHDAGARAARLAGVRLVPVTDAGPALEAAALVVDGIVGIGGRGALRGVAVDLVAAVDALRPFRVAVDVPSGVDADTGAVAGAAFTADVTVAPGCLKPGLLVSPGAGHAGVVTVVDIGLAPSLAGRPVGLAALEAADVAARWPAPDASADKYTRGVLRVVAGSEAYPGAAVLCTSGALRAGAGMVRFPGGDAAARAARDRWPETVAADGRVQAVVVGPGLGTDDDGRRRLAEALADDVPAVVDADGLGLLAGAPDLVRGRAALTVLTPHDREYERLGGPVGDDRVGAARRLAADLGATVLLKGSTTVVADADGRAHVNPTGTAWLATAGSGDVLSGITGALLAAGLGVDAPVLAAYVHGLAGRLASEGGPVTAVDVADAVPEAVRTVRAAADDRIAR
jgi:ADP-dependent NAD(P)H-hydrate dehydratase / NAD(P)H-hydrate epimerase